MKKLLTVVVAVVVVLVLSLYAVGSMQPVDHVASMRATYAAPPEEVWALMTDFEGYPAWNTMFPQVTRADDVDGKPCWVLEGEWGPMPSVVDLLEPPGRMVTRIAPDADIGFEGTWSYWLEPAADGGCTLRIQEDGSVTSPLMRGMALVMFDDHDSMNSFLGDLGAHLGEDTVPERVTL